MPRLHEPIVIPKISDVLLVVDICNMTEHISLKHKVKSISSKSKFLDVLDDSMLTNTEKEVMVMYYIKGQTLNYIADFLGYSEQGVVKIHKRALKKIAKLL